MLTLGAQSSPDHNILPIEADALHLPLAYNSVDLVTSAFGFRNLANYPTASPNSTASSAPAARSPSSSATSPTASSARSTTSTSNTSCPPSAASSPAQPRAYAYLPDSVEVPPPTPHDSTHRSRRLHQPHLDQLHPRHRRPLPRHQTLERAACLFSSTHLKISLLSFSCHPSRSGELALSLSKGICFSSCRCMFSSRPTTNARVPHISSLRCGNVYPLPVVVACSPQPVD